MFIAALKTSAGAAVALYVVIPLFLSIIVIVVIIVVICIWRRRQRGICCAFRYGWPSSLDNSHLADSLHLCILKHRDHWWWSLLSGVDSLPPTVYCQLATIVACTTTFCLQIHYFYLWSPYGIGRPYIFSCCGLFFFLLLFFPRLISAAADWMSAILPHIVWP